MMNQMNVVKRQESTAFEKQTKTEMQELLVGRTISGTDIHLTTHGGLQDFTILFEDGDKLTLYEDVVDISKCKLRRPQTQDNRVHVCKDTSNTKLVELEIMIDQSIRRLQDGMPHGELQKEAKEGRLDAFNVVKLLIKSLKSASARQG
jgi:hypothetical protein